MKTNIDIQKIKEKIIKTMNSHKGSGSYNDAWIDGYSYLAKELFDISYDYKRNKWIIK